MRNASDKCFIEYQNTHFMFSNMSYWKFCHLWDNVEKFSWAKQAPYDNWAQDRCML